MLRFRSSSCSDHISSPLPGKGVRFITTLHAWHKCPQALGVYSMQHSDLRHMLFHFALAEHVDQLPYMCPWFTLQAIEF